MRLKILCRILITAALGALSVSGLAGQTNPSVYATRTNPSAKPRTARTIDPKSAYTEKRWIGLLRKGGQCPPVAGWAAAPLLAQPKAAADRSLYRALGLDRFCVYTATPDSPQPFVPPAGLV